MSMIDEALNANATIANDYDPSPGQPPAPKIAIVTCADLRLSNIEQMRQQPGPAAEAPSTRNQTARPCQRRC